MSPSPLLSRPHSHFVCTPSHSHPERFGPFALHADVVAISAGGRHSMILMADSSVWATGDNEYGQLGDGTTVGKTRFVKVMPSGQSYAHTYPHVEITITYFTVPNTILINNICRQNSWPRYHSTRAQSQHLEQARQRAWPARKRHTTPHIACAVRSV